MPQAIVTHSIVTQSRVAAAPLRIGQSCPFRAGCLGILVLDEDIEDGTWVRELVCSGCSRREGQHRPPSADERAEAEDWQARRREEIARRTKHHDTPRGRGSAAQKARADEGRLQRALEALDRSGHLEAGAA